MHKLVFTLLLTSAVVAAGSRRAAAAAPRPNILFIIADDLYVDMLNFTEAGRGKNLTPHLDQLAAEGTVLEGQHIVSPVCTPSRYNCLTGRYAGRATNPQFLRQTERAGTTIVTWNSKITAEDNTLPKRLQAAGYVTGISGKQHVVDVPGRQRPPADADPRAPEVKAMLAKNERAEREALRQIGFDEAGGIYTGNAEELSPAVLRVHNMDWVAQAGLDFIGRHAGKGRPFFLYFAPTLAHSPYPPERSWNADPRLTPYGVLEKAPAVLPSREDRARRLREHSSNGRRREMLLWLDDAIGVLRRKLEETGELGRTVIFFFNDNGQDGKGSVYQSAAWCPSLVWRKGGFPVGRRSGTGVTNLDFAPTILELAGAPAPREAFDGRSFRAVLEGRTEPIHATLYFELGFTRGVRQGDWKYIALRYPPQPERFALANHPPHLQGIVLPPGQPAFGHIGGNNNEMAALRTQPAYFDRDQLYSLAEDPREQRNLAGDPRHAAKLAEMQRHLQRHLAQQPGGFGEIKPAGAGR